MPIRKTTFNFAEFFPPVLATPHGLRSPRGVDLDPALVSQYAGAKGILQKIVPPGVFAAAIPGSTKFRPLPRTKLAAASVTSSPTLTVKKHTAQLFVPGDTLSIPVPFAQITFAAAWVAGETLTITVGGRTFNYVVPSPAPVDNTALVADVAAKLAKSAINGLVEAFASGSVLTLASLIDQTSPFTVAETSTAGTALPASGNLAQGGAIGTVLSVTYNPDTDVHTLTLAANAAIALPIGCPIGDVRYSPVGLGIMTPNTAIDLFWEENTMAACFTSCTVYRARLPYWDGQLAALFPEITLM
jgi:hypothetical protein